MLFSTNVACDATWVEWIGAPSWLPDGQTWTVQRDGSCGRQRALRGPNRVKGAKDAMEQRPWVAPPFWFCDARDWPATPLKERRLDGSGGYLANLEGWSC